MMSFSVRLCEKLNRRKTLEDDVMETPLRRCLNTMDLTLLGIGHMVGAGIFVLTGTVVHSVAGPATVLSYLLAGIAALLSSLCYAEYGARVPKAGSAYTYTYVTMGEFWAFIIGWNLILEHMLGIASVARAWSGSLDAILGGVIRNGTLTHIGEMNVPGLSNYVDFMALVSILVVVAFIAGGAKISVNFNSVFTLINILVILLIISVGFSLAEGSNWSNSKTGGFLPMGFPGVFAGAATCFYAYIGFEGIAVAGEEAKNPEKSVPLATGLAMAIVTLMYVGSSASLTLMVPWNTVDQAAPFPAAFAARGLMWVKYVVAVGALFGITTSLIGGLFSLPRAVYSIASDGLFFRVFSHVHPRTQTPLVSIITFGLLSAICALIFDIEVLVEFLSIGTLLSFTIVAAGVIILRYQSASKCQFQLKPEEAPEEESDSDRKKIVTSSQSHHDIGKLKDSFQRIPYIRDIDPAYTTVGSVVAMGIFMVAFCILLLFGYEYIASPAWWAIILLILFTAGMILPFMVLLMHEPNKSFLTFQVPLVPLLPALSMLMNIAMMLKLSYLTWVRLAIWMIIGLFIYFIYGINHSNENRPLAAYSTILSYSGSEPGEPLGKMDERLHLQQPGESLDVRDQQPSHS